MAGPCTAWTTPEAVLAVPKYSNVDADVLAVMVDVASEILYDLSGRQFPGVCTATVRPCSRDRWADRPYWWRWMPDWGTCACAATQSCGCSTLPEISLGAYPLRTITEVRIDGAALDPTAYRIDDYRWLVRIDGDGWPCCQDLTADPVTDLDTFSVAFEWGLAPTPAGVNAANVFAAELTLCQMGQPTRLPERVQSVVRDGMSFTVLDPQTFIEDGKTGIYVVDLFLHAKNPHKARRRAAVFSPEFPPPVRRTSTTPGS